MAFNATAVGRVRIGGNAANGAFYDPAIPGAGTDYTQQDSAQLTLSDIACSNTTTVTSATGGFTSAMIGNAIRITGGGSTTGYYFITGCTDTNTITVDRTPGTVSGGSGRVGGAADLWQTLANNSNATGNKCVAGNIIYIRGSGTDTPSSNDYATTNGFVTPPSGNATDGPIQFIGENGRPRISETGLMFYNGSYLIFKNLYLTASSNVNGSLGILYVGANSLIDDVIVDTNGKTGTAGIVLNSNGNTLRNSEVFSASSKPASSANAHGVISNSYGNNIYNVVVRHMPANGIRCTSSLYGVIVSKCLIYGNVDNSIYLEGGASTGNVIVDNTIDGGSGHGIHFNTTVSLARCIVQNNLITNHNQASKYAINVAAGTTALNDRMKGILDYNFFYGNTANYNAITGGANDVTGTDPGYVNASTGNFAIGSALKGAAWPGTFKNSLSISYPDPGAVQRQEQTALKRLGWNGGFNG